MREAEHTVHTRDPTTTGRLLGLEDTATRYRIGGWINLPITLSTLPQLSYTAAAICY